MLPPVPLRLALPLSLFIKVPLAVGISADFKAKSLTSRKCGVPPRMLNCISYHVMAVQISPCAFVLLHHFGAAYSRLNVFMRPS